MLRAPLSRAIAQAVAATALVGWLGGCAQVAEAPGGGAPAAAGWRAEDFLVVDCTVPGQIRQLGTQTTYVSPPRALKTAARDCGLRGGEYVAYDRADYRSALKVWLPRAQQGDAEAQTYVGEIYERGVGLPSPDYRSAVEYYRKAASAGYAKAAINLGALYELGRGVERNRDEARRWYAKAGGIDRVVYQEAPVAVAALGGSVRERELERELEVTRAELARTQRDKEALAKRLDERRAEADAERAALAKARQELDTARRAGGTRQRELEQGVAQREAAVTARDREVSDLRAALAKSEADATARRAELDRARQQSGAEAERAQRESAAELARVQRDAEALRKSLAERGTAADAERRTLTQLRADLEAAKAREHGAASRQRELEQAVTQREASIAARDREISGLRTQMARVEQQSATKATEAERLRQRGSEAAPVIEVLEPEMVATRATTRSARGPSSGDRLLVVGRVTAAGGLHTLTVNGREERADAAGMFKTQVPLPRGDEPVRIAAVDKAGRRSTFEFGLLAPGASATAAVGPDTPRVGYPKTGKETGFGSYHALVIGNNEYRNLKRLRTAVRDAEVVADILGRDYGFKVTLLRNADRYTMLSALNSMREKLTDKDNLFIYYAGHGERDEINQRGHWLPVDAEPNSPANWISNIAVTDILNAMTVRQLLVVADSCYAGTLTRSSGAQLQGGLTPEQRLGVVERMAQKRSRMVLTSGGIEPVLDSVGGPHSVFAQTFIELLRQNAGVLVGQELFGLLQQRVAAAAGQRVADAQIPEYAPIKFAGHEAGDFIFVKTAAR